MNGLTIDISQLTEFANVSEIFSYQNDIEKYHQSLLDRTGPGNDFLGWMRLPSELDANLISRIENEAQRLGDSSEIIVVIGIGGSYLGARAVIEALNSNLDLLCHKKEAPFVLYAGHQLGEDYLADLLEILEKKDYSLIVISKSGTTTEPAIAFRIFRNHLIGKYGRKKAFERIIAITDKSKGALKKLSDVDGYSTFIVPDNVGGRYSVLTPVGLLPIAAAGLNIKELIEGASEAESNLLTSSRLEENPAALYAAARNTLYQKGKTIEVLANYVPALYYLTEWWKQLYGESEGKDHKGIFPASVNFTTDLHSLGQYIQDGLRNIFETMLMVDNTKRDVRIPFDEANHDGLNYIAEKKIHDVNKMAALGTMLAHVDGGVPVIKINLSYLDENHLGKLLYFYEYACALSGYILQVNPFDQPGVEAYKTNMFALLGKTGFEKESNAIKKRLNMI